jgi:hypothetical protein
MSYNSPLSPFRPVPDYTKPVPLGRPSGPPPAPKK